MGRQSDPNSMLRWFENLVHTLRTAPEIGFGTCSVVQASLPRSVLALRFDAPAGYRWIRLSRSDRA